MPTDIQALGGTVLTELARTFENFATTVGRFFPSRSIPDSKVTVERIYGGAGMAPVVDPTKPDVFTDSRQVESMSQEPVYSRESFHINNQKLNSLRQPGTLNERYGRQYIADEMRRLVARNDLLFDFLRSQMLLGGVDYTDPRTNKRTVLPAGIPAGNIVPLANLMAAWSDTANAKPIDDLEGIKMIIRDAGKVEPSHILMTSVTRSRLSRNAQVLARGESARDAGFVVFQNGELARIAGLEVVVQDAVYEALAPAAVPTVAVTIGGTITAGNTARLTIGGKDTLTYTVVSGDSLSNVAANLANYVNGDASFPVSAAVNGAIITLAPKNALLNQSIPVTASASGTLTATVAGSPIAVTGGGLVKTVTKMIPDNKVVVLSQSNAGEPVGRTDFVIGEHPAGQPGIWSRAADTVPPDAPGVLVQVGRAGMPYLLHPDWVAVVTVAA